MQLALVNRCESMIAKIRCRAQSCANAAKHSAMLGLLSLLLAAGLIESAALAHGTTAKGIRLAQATTELGILKGRWVRPDGGYVVLIKSVDPSGKMDATYLNPNPIKVSKAEVSRDGETLRVFLELRDAGYPGSTYTLTYEPRSDSLIGVYFQAVMQQKFNVVFQRAK